MWFKNNARIEIYEKEVHLYPLLTNERERWLLRRIDCYTCRLRRFEDIFSAKSLKPAMTTQERNWLFFHQPLMTAQWLDIFRSKWPRAPFSIKEVRCLIDLAKIIRLLYPRTLPYLQELATANLRLVIGQAWLFIGRGVDLVDLIGEGNFGLERAIERIDYRRKIKFSTYGTSVVHRFIRDAIFNHSRTIRIPSSQYFPGSRALSSKTISLDNEKETGIEEEFIDRPWHEQEILTKIRPLLDKAIKDEREREIIKMRFGLNSSLQPMTLEEIGDHFDITKERVRQLEKRTLCQLSHHPEMQHIREANFE